VFILDLRQRLRKTEATLTQRRRVQQSLLRPPITAGGIEGRVQLLEADAQQSNELLLSFIHSKAPPGCTNMQWMQCTFFSFLSMNNLSGRKFVYSIHLFGAKYNKLLYFIPC
jgi:aconitase B